MDSNDKSLVASVLERGKRRRDDDGLLDNKDELEEQGNGISAAAELGVDVAIDDADKTPGRSRRPSSIPRRPTSQPPRSSTRSPPT